MDINALPVFNLGLVMDKRLSYQDLENEISLVRNELLLKDDEVNKLKSSFLSNVSHEIRTPMNVIVGFSNLLSDPHYNKDQKSFFVDEINKNSLELLRLIDNIIITAKVESDNIKLNMSEFDVSVVMKELYIHFQKKLKYQDNQKIKLQLASLSSSKAMKIFSDSAKLKHALFNLIDNALKYTINGTVEFGCEVKNNRFVEFYVKDTGIGINGKDVSKIYRKFTQSPNNYTHTNNGLGIGLTISDKLIRLLGGKLTVRSTLGKGSLFHFNLPLLVKNPV